MRPVDPALSLFMRSAVTISRASPSLPHLFSSSSRFLPLPIPPCQSITIQNRTLTSCPNVFKGSVGDQRDAPRKLRLMARCKRPLSQTSTRYSHPTLRHLPASSRFVRTSHYYTELELLRLLAESDAEPPLLGSRYADRCMKPKQSFSQRTCTALMSRLKPFTEINRKVVPVLSLPFRGRL